MSNYARFLLIGTLIILLGSTAIRQASPRSQMARAAQSFVQALPDELREQAVLPFESENRFDWHFVPRSGRGVTLAQLNDEQRRAVHRLLRAGLSEQGYLKATGVMMLEDILRDLESRPGRPATHRDSGLYRVTIFGDPTSEEAWGWRVEGHHLSLNFSSVSDAWNAVTPFFLGANPATVPSGPYAGWRLLGSEADIARSLVASMDERQAAIAIINEQAPRDILFGPGTDPATSEREGIRFADLNDEQQAGVRRLVEVVCRNITPELSAAYPGEMWPPDVAADVCFAWAGGLDPGDGHYWRVHGQTFIIEYDNTQNNANHVHLVWRDLTNDFGRDWLREHLEDDHDHD